MKQNLLLACLVFIFSASQAQISVRVKKNSSGSEVDVMTSGKPGGTKEAEAKPASGETKSTPAPNTEKPSADTASKPSAGVSFDESYNGKAKVQLKSFWRYMEKLRSGDKSSATLGNAIRMLDQVKQADPAYNVSALETEIATYSDKANKEAQAKNDAKGKAETETQYFNSVWQKITDIYSKGVTIEKAGKPYYDLVQAINLGEYQEKKKTARGESGVLVKKIDEALADYDNYLTRSDRLRWNVTEVMVKSRGQANPQIKIQLLEQAKYECEAVLLMSPGNTAFKQKLDEVNKLLGTADGEASKFYTSDFHKQNVGKIVWSNKPLVIGKEKDMAANIKTGFKTGEAIFGTMYLGNNLKQLMNGNTMMRIVIRIDGGTAVWGGDLSYIIVPLTVQDKSYLQFALLPDEQWFNTNYAPYVKEENWTYSYFMDDLAKAGDISHTITCELKFPTNIQSDIKSSLLLDLSDGSVAIKSLSTKLHDQLMASRTLPKAGMSNAALEQQMVAAANNLGWNDKFSKAVITSSSWTIAKNDLTGAILYRWLHAVCTIKGTDGKCYYQEFSFKQEYTGGGNYSSTVKFNSYGGKREIGCDKIK